MNKVRQYVLGIATALTAAGLSAGCGGSKSALPVGTGGKAGVGGSTGAGGVIASGGATTGMGGAMTGTGGAMAVDSGSPDGAAPKCSEVTTEEACNARDDCHAVFVDPGTCGCAAAGCCARFKACADGAEANCTGPAVCEMMTPNCEQPYVVAYSGSCYEGCVRQTDCAAPSCPPDRPEEGSPCPSVSFACQYKLCDVVPITAYCSGGTWTIDLRTCGPP